MNGRQTDFDLLRRFVRQGDQAAFAAVVRRHLDLVYATALRKAEDEDAAQKRVAGALEQLAQFFQRRGFRTATAAATAAALQHTAVSVSATTAALVVNGALQSAPPMLAGLTGLL